MTKADQSEKPALLGFHIRERETTVIWADETSREPEVKRAAVTAGEIAHAATTLHTLFAPQNINFRRPEYTTDLAWLAPLGHRLLAPVARRLRARQRLVISSNAALNSLPLHMLAPEGREPLGTTHSISYVPNFSTYAALLDRGMEQATPMTLPSLCLATPAAEDPKRIADDFLIAPRAFSQTTGGVFHQGRHASVHEFRASAGQAAMIYLSCHGRFDRSNSVKSRLLLSDGQSLPSRVTENQGSLGLSVADILSVSIRSPLVILDACMSGIQRIAAGDEPMGFPTAFLLSGASAVIASTWSVEQNVARDFMLTLAKIWSQGGPLGDAMRDAMAMSRGQFPHPFHWAVFSLFGNDRITFSEAHTQ